MKRFVIVALVTMASLMLLASTALADYGPIIRNGVFFVAR